jgi:hypothetical protein
LFVVALRACAVCGEAGQNPHPSQNARRMGHPAGFAIGWKLWGRCALGGRVACATNGWRSEDRRYVERIGSVRCPPAGLLELFAGASGLRDRFCAGVEVAAGFGIGLLDLS